MEPQEKLGKLRHFLYGTVIGNVIILVIILAFVYALIYVVKQSDFSLDPDSSLGDSGETTDANCNITGINLHGTLVTYIPVHAEGDTLFDYDTTGSEDVISTIEQANKSENIKAIVVEVDSAGGYPVAGEEIADAIKNSEKPVVAFIRGIGASAAYWAVSRADKIFASRNSDVGSIGVTMSYLSNVEKNNQEGYKYEQLNSGKFKDSGSVDKPLTAEEKALFIRDINIVYENFMADVSENRKIPIEKIRSFADGSTVLGVQAKELGLIDEIGGIGEVEKYLEGTTGEKPEICWY